MDLNEAISHAKEVVEEKREEVKYWKKVKGVGVFTDENTEHLLNKCEECAKEHEQLAAWLTELQERREADKWILIGKRKPDIDEEVLVCYRTQGGMAQMVSYRMDNERWWGLSVLCYTPVAWKPLGEPYKRPYTRKRG